MSSSREAPAEHPRSSGAPGRRPSSITTLASLVGAHPDTLRKLFSEGSVADPAELGEVTRGLVLSIPVSDEIFLAMRPIVRLISSSGSPWKGKTFDHGGNSGQNLVFGKLRSRFRAEVAPSAIDGQPALRLLYADPAFGNAWPVRDLVDELRGVAPGMAIGPVLHHGRILAWFGLERS
ncbi:MAG: hypothetical protein ABJE95_35200 [Byssovorax sp.]